MPFVDKHLICRDCGSNFTFTAGEQKFFQSRGLTHTPMRCRDCRASRRSAGDQPEPDEGYTSYGSFASFGGRTPRQMHPITCSECGQAAEVPFEPDPNKPVYCSNCYDDKRNESS